MVVGQTSDTAATLPAALAGLRWHWHWHWHGPWNSHVAPEEGPIHCVRRLARLQRCSAVAFKDAQLSIGPAVVALLAGARHHNWARDCDGSVRVAWFAEGQPAVAVPAVAAHATIEEGWEKE